MKRNLSTQIMISKLIRKVYISGVQRNQVLEGKHKLVRRLNRDL